jgi:hypothetical protein
MEDELNLWLLSSATLIAASIATVTFAADFEFSNLKGSWKVEGVAVPNTGVQALVDNDPQYMGAVVEFGADQIKWTKGTKTRPIDPSIDNCAASPTIKPWAADPDFPDEAPIEGGFTVMCGTDEWGTVVPVDEKTVKLHWLDNGVLTLKRE